MNAKRLIPQSSTVGFLVTLAFLGFLYITKDDGVTSERMEIPVGYYDPKISKTVIAGTKADISVQLDQLKFDRHIHDLIENSKFKQARVTLLEKAALAVQGNDKNRLGDIMLLLGKVATNEMEFGVAEAYLEEALDIATQSGDTLAEANTYQQLGKLHIRSRELARIAGNAYENLWHVKNQIYMGEYRFAEDNLRQIIDTSLAIQRYGAAANAYETLAKFHRRFHDDFKAQSAILEAAKLFASSGRFDRSREIITRLEQEGADAPTLTLAKAEITGLYQKHQDNVSQISQARDYQMLYQYYNSRGEFERAWKLRILASKSLANTSERSMYSRQADVMAILYSSNFAMDKARSYLDRASDLFAIRGDDDLYANVQDMQSLIY
jgi:tetratricopeptide (TPR) repeat protein